MQRQWSLSSGFDDIEHHLLAIVLGFLEHHGPQMQQQ
jgi:hypothetical protein